MTNAVGAAVLKVLEVSFDSDPHTVQGGAYQFSVPEGLSQPQRVESIQQQVVVASVWQEEDKNEPGMLLGNWGNGGCWIENVAIEFRCVAKVPMSEFEESCVVP